MKDMRSRFPRASEEELHQPGIGVRQGEVAVEADGELEFAERLRRCAHGVEQETSAETRPRAGRREGDGLRDRCLRSLDLVGSVVRNVGVHFPQMSVGETEQRRDVSIVEAERGLEETARCPHRLQAQGLVPDRLAAHGEINGVEIIGPLARRPPAFGRGELDLDHAGEPGDNLVLHAEEIGARLVEPLGPEMRPSVRVDQLRVDPDTVSRTLDAAFHDVAHAKLAADLARIDGLALVGEGGVPSDHDSAGNARQIRRQALGDAIDERILLLAATDIGEGHHHNRKSRWV